MITEKEKFTHECGARLTEGVWDFCPQCSEPIDGTPTVDSSAIYYSHPNAVITVTNSCEFAYMVAWCEMQGKGTPFMGEPKYPMAISVGGNLSGWTDRMDRALFYIPFEDFIKQQNEGYQP